MIYEHPKCIQMYCMNGFRLSIIFWYFSYCFPHFFNTKFYVWFNSYLSYLGIILFPRYSFQSRKAWPKMYWICWRYNINSSKIMESFCACQSWSVVICIVKNKLEKWIIDLVEVLKLRISVLHDGMHRNLKYDMNQWLFQDFLCDVTLNPTWGSDKKNRGLVAEIIACAIDVVFLSS